MNSEPAYQEYLHVTANLMPVSQELAHKVAAELARLQAKVAELEHGVKALHAERDGLIAEVGSLTKDKFALGDERSREWRRAENAEADNERLQAALALVLSKSAAHCTRVNPWETRVIYHEIILTPAHYEQVNQVLAGNDGKKK